MDTHPSKITVVTIIKFYLYWRRRQTVLKWIAMYCSWLAGTTTNLENVRICC